MTTNGNTQANVPLWLDNKPLSIDNDRLYPVVQSTTGKTIHHYHSATVEDALKAAVSSGKAFKSWKRATVAKRREVLYNFANIIERDADKFLKLQKDETSAGDLWARNNVNTVAAYTREISSVISNVNGVIPSIDVST